jgi:hypothetical protein
MIPDPEHMTKLALSIEKNAHSMGWDSLPPILGMVFDDVVGLVSAPSPIQPAQLSDDLADGLRIIAKNMRDSRARGETLGSLDRLAALWIVYEAWINTAVDPDLDPRRLADIPGTQECRQVLILDMSGLLTMALRIRGDPPSVESFEALAGRVSSQMEDILLALRDVLLEHAVEMAEEDADIVTLAAWTGSGTS